MQDEGDNTAERMWESKVAYVSGRRSSVSNGKTQKVINSSKPDSRIDRDSIGKSSATSTAIKLRKLGTKNIIGGIDARAAKVTHF